MAAISSASSQFVFFPPQEGKPGKKLGDPPRIQSPQKGLTCRYYAAKILCNWKGTQDIPLSPKSGRPVTHFFSSHRKALSRIDALWLDRITLATTTKFLLGSISKKEVQTFFERTAGVLPESLSKLSNQLIQPFCEQTSSDEFHDFVQTGYAQEKMKVHETLFSEIDLSMETVKSLAYSMRGKTWEEMKTSERECAEANVVFRTFCHLHGFRRSSWHPEQPVEALINELQLHHQLFVNGNIGKTYYMEPAIVAEKIQGRTVFGWKPNALRNDSIGFTHAVVLIGAKVEDKKGYVYFVDPQDGSSPKDPTVRKVYKTSYERLKSTISNLWNQQQRDSTGKPVFQPVEDGVGNYAMFIQ
jgi:hypothetical protein